jgi:hypothetical protein
MIEYLLSAQKQRNGEIYWTFWAEVDLASCLTDGCAKNLKPWQVVM